MDTLDQWVTPQPTEVKKPLIISDAHADYLYEQSHGRMMDKMYEAQIKAFLEEERAEKEAHKKYVDSNYIRVGEKNGKN